MIEDIETHYLYVPTIYYEQVNVVEKRRTLLVPWANNYVECGSNEKPLLFQAKLKTKPDL
jgi:hypothetical protein